MLKIPSDCVNLAREASKHTGSESALKTYAAVNKLGEQCQNSDITHDTNALIRQISTDYSQLPQADRHFLAPKILSSARKLLKANQQSPIAPLVSKIATDAVAEHWLTQNYELYELDYIVGDYLHVKNYSAALPLQKTVTQLTDNIADTMWMSCNDHELLAEIYERLGRKAEAYEQYQIASNYCDLSPTAQEMRPHLTRALQRLRTAS